jgi:putative transposase
MGQRRRRHTPEQVIRKLREADRLLGEGVAVPEVAKELEVSEQTLHRWRLQYGGLKAEDAKRLKELERENAKLKRIVADQLLEIDAWKEIGRGKLVSPSRRRAAVAMLSERLGVSERRACRITGQHRSTQRHRSPAHDRDDALRDELRRLSRAHPRWGYRRAWASLREQGWEANRKKIQRLWREEGLRVPRRTRKRQRLGASTVEGARLRAERPDQVWALDFQFDTTVDGRVLKLLHVVDEHTREALAIEVERRIDADRTVAVLDRIVRRRGHGPELLRMDNGPELTAYALRDWCRFGGSGSSYIEPGSPWENPFVESFASRVRDELLAVEAFDSLLEAKTVIEEWRNIYNTRRPHSSLGWKTPAAYAAAWSQT